jgi:hypothetical protein
LATLHVALQDGFSNDAVSIKVNGREVFRRDGVSTRTQIGLAAAHEMSVDEGSATVEVDLPDRRLSSATTIAVTGDVYLGVSVDGQNLKFVQSSQLFGYL